MKWIWIACLATISSATFAAPYETVAVYKKTTGDGTKELEIGDQMSSDEDVPAIPSDFTSDDGSRYRLTKVEQRLDVENADGPYMLPFTSVVATATVPAPDHSFTRIQQSITLDANRTTGGWTVADLVGDSLKPIH